MATEAGGSKIPNNQETKQILQEIIEREASEMLTLIDGYRSSTVFPVEGGVVGPGPVYDTYRSSGLRYRVEAVVSNGSQTQKSFNLWGKYFRRNEDGLIVDSLGRDCTVACYLEAERHWQFSRQVAEAPLTVLLYRQPVGLEIQEAIRTPQRVFSGVKEPFVQVFEYFGSDFKSETLGDSIYPLSDEQFKVLGVVAKGTGRTREELYTRSRRKVRKMGKDRFYILLDQLIDLGFVTDSKNGSNGGTNSNGRLSLSPGFPQVRFREGSEFVGDNRAYYDLREQLITHALSTILNFQEDANKVDFKKGGKLLEPVKQDTESLMDRRFGRLEEIASYFGTEDLLKERAGETFRKAYIDYILSPPHKSEFCCRVHGDTNLRNILMKPNPSGTDREGYANASFKLTGLKRMNVSHWYRDPSKYLLQLRIIGNPLRIALKPASAERLAVQSLRMKKSTLGSSMGVDFQRNRTIIDLDECVDLLGAVIGILNNHSDELTPSRLRGYHEKVEPLADELENLVRQAESDRQFTGEPAYKLKRLIQRD